MNELKQYADMTEKALRGFLDDPGLPEDMAGVMAYSVLAGGKRLRPALLLSACALCGGNAEAALPFACAVEFIHTYSLIHDDLPAIDNDDYRRGRKTSHKQFDEGKAILAGDALLSYAFEIMAEHCTVPGGVKALQEIAHACGARGMVAGQWVDVKLSGKFTDEETMHYIHLHKTADMIRGALLAGAALGGANEEQTSALQTYGTELGYTFQIVDDILDVTGNAELLGKPVGSDRENGKTTYVTLYGPDGAAAKAAEHTSAAVEALACFGSQADFLRTLAVEMLRRSK